jgi:hypothetical protein
MAQLIAQCRTCLSQPMRGLGSIGKAKEGQHRSGHAFEACRLRETVEAHADLHACNLRIQYSDPPVLVMHLP